MSEVIGALSHALDITEGQPLGHSVRCCWIGLNTAKNLNFTEEQLIELYYTILLKDTGCSTNSSRLYEIFRTDDISNKRDVKTVDIQKLTSLIKFVFTHFAKGRSYKDMLKRIFELLFKHEQIAIELVAIRCERGAEIALMLGLGQTVSSGIYSLDEHWNGKGRPMGLSTDSIPIYSRVALLSQVADVFNSLHGPKSALKEVITRSGSWFDPDVVEAFADAVEKSDLWTPINSPNLEEKVESLVSKFNKYELNEDSLDQIASTFGLIVDAKSPYTSEHSKNISYISEIIAQEMGLDQDRCRWIKRGALLHDIGKLAISNAILNKPEPLTSSEYDAIKKHPVYTEQILSRFGPFKEMAKFAAAHHERLDGKGYPKGLKGDEIPIETRIITVCDIYQALIERRPYREAMSVEKALQIMEDMRDSAIDSNCFEILKAKIPDITF